MDGYVRTCLDVSSCLWQVYVFSLSTGHSYNDFVEALTVVVQHAFAEPCLISQRLPFPDMLQRPAADSCKFIAQLVACAFQALHVLCDVSLLLPRVWHPGCASQPSWKASGGCWFHECGTAA